MKHVWCIDFSWLNQFEAAHGTFVDLVGRFISKPWVIKVFATIVDAREGGGGVKESPSSFCNDLGTIYIVFFQGRTF